MGNIKGWTKVKLTGTIKHRWEHRLTKRTINIERYSPDKWFANIRNSNGVGIKSSKSFDDIKKTNDYAIKYMRSHPNG